MHLVREIDPSQMQLTESHAHRRGQFFGDRFGIEHNYALRSQSSPLRIKQVLKAQRTAEAHDLGAFDGIHSLISLVAISTLPILAFLQRVVTHAATRAAAATPSVPAGVSTGVIRLSNPARSSIPATVLMGSLDRAGLEAEFAEDVVRFGAEYHAIQDIEVLTIGSGHWP